jgi:Kelch motif protein/S-layer family protein
MSATGIVYCAEGDTGNGFASYNTATDTWTSLAPAPGSPHYGSASGAFGGKVFVAGGTTGFTNAVQVYDVATNTWSAGTAAPSGFLLAGYQQVGQFLYVVGGFSGTPLDATQAQKSSVLSKGASRPEVPLANLMTTWRLDMTSAPGAWSNGPAFTPGRADFGLAYDAGTGKLYAMGGDATGGGFFDSTNLVNELSVGAWPAGTWAASAPNLPIPNRQANQAGFYGAGQIWSVGGINGATFQFLAEVWRRTNGAGGGCPSPTVGASSTATTAASATRTTAPSATTAASATTGASATRTSTVGASATTGASATRTSTVGPTATHCGISFSDVPTNHPFYQWIRCLACRHIVGGYADGTFRPENNITRGQISKIVDLSAGFSDPIPPTRQTYQDVPPGSTFWLFIEQLTLHGVMGGYACGGVGEPCVPPTNRPYFRPGNNATRGQLTKIVSNAAGLSDPPSGQTFEDVPPGHPFYVYIYRLVLRGSIGGYPCGVPPAGPCIPPANRPYFLPDNFVTRGQAARIDAETFFPGCNPAGLPATRVDQ